ncbi:MAG: Ig-like domain-containing protein [Bacteroidales bacterium]|jgi:hypothetical protein|nr:Ig-like domain-containing protein [Bacteroidales bacterium]
MKQRKNKNTLKLLLSILLLLGAHFTVSAQLSPGYLSGMATVGENPTLANGNLTIGNAGELFLGTHLPRLQQTNTLYWVGEYVGEAGSQAYLSVVNNTNTSGSRGFIDVVGTANGSTEIILDMFNGWDGSCIDLARAYRTGSDLAAFQMREADYNGHHAYLKTRVTGSDIIWYLAEHIILGEYLSPAGQSRCANSNVPFDPLTVQMPANGSYLYQWYKSSNPDGSNAIPVSSANGGQTASYTPEISSNTTFYYFCVVRNANCSEYSSETTGVSGAITVYDEPKIHIFGANLCIGRDTTFTAEVFAGDNSGTGHWHISEGMAASIDEHTGLVKAHATGRFTVTYHYQTPGGCSVIVTSQEYEVFAKPVSEVQDIVLCSPQTIPASSLIKNLINADTYKIYDSNFTEITGQNIQATAGTKTYYVEAINTDCHCVAHRVAVHVTVTDAITFDLPATASLCGSTRTDLADLVSNVNISDYRVEVYRADGTLLLGTLVPVSEQPYFVKIVSTNGNCASVTKSIVISASNGTLRIVEQPQVQSYCRDCGDDDVTFRVVAEGAQSYQWYEVRKGVTTALDGETSDILVIAGSDIDPNISYYVTVKGGCGGSDGSGATSINSNLVYAEECLNLIIQKKNHTLEVNNNSATNGGYKFGFYEWYKNNKLIHSGAYGEGRGGYYYTGANATLDPHSEYYVIVTDQNGVKHHTCPFSPKLFVYETKIQAYPNPALQSSPLVVVDVETNEEELLENGAITVYSSIGQYIGRVRTEGHRITPVQLPPVPAVYILKFISGEFEKEIKVIVK